MTEDYEVYFHVYGRGGTSIFPAKNWPTPPEIFVLVECLAASQETAKAVVAVTKQYLLHYGFPQRFSTGGNIAFPFTPPELAAGSAYKFSMYHVMECDELESLFPIHEESIGCSRVDRTQGEVRR